jgi:hypothetical protein
MKNSKTDLVRSITSENHNRQIDEKTIEYLNKYAKKSDRKKEARILELEKEWDIERALELNAAALGLSGVLLSTRNRNWLILPGVVTAFLIQHAVQGWCPPIELFRALGVRTRKEIDQEKYALKALRGDFKEIQGIKDAWQKAK